MMRTRALALAVLVVSVLVAAEASAARVSAVGLIDFTKPNFKVGDWVQDCVWDGAYVGNVRRVDEDGDVFVKWDGHLAEDQMAPHQITKIGDAR